MISEDETKIITSIISHIEAGERRIGIQQIASENYVSSTFIIKMCKRLGFEGYSELYYHLSQTVDAYGKTTCTARLHERVDNYRDGMEEDFCRLLVRLVERVLVYEDNRIEIVFHYQTQFDQAMAVASSFDGLAGLRKAV